jgi:tetratricopeptide (TPR) repeat protein
MAVTSLVFINSLNNGFVWDDWILMVPNEIYRSFDLKGMFLSKANALEYLPFRDLTLAIDYLLWGPNPFGFHLANLLFYLFGLMALYRMVLILVDLSGKENREMIAFWTTLIFALHPLHVEVVNFIGARNTLLAGLFVFLSFNLCITGIREGRRSFVYISVFLFFIALFSKAVVVFYPVFLTIVLFFAPGINLSPMKKFMVLLPFYVLDALAMWVHIRIAQSTAIMSEQMPSYGIHSTHAMLAKAFQIPFFYLKMLVIPHPLSIRYTVSFMKSWALPILVPAVIYLMICVLVILALKKRKYVTAFAVIWFFLSLGPVLNIFPTSPVVADRYAYFPVFGFGLCIACILQNTLAGRFTLMFIAVGIIIAWGGLNVQRNRDWRSDISLWESALAADQDTGRSELAMALWNAGRRQEALSYFMQERDERGGYEYSLYRGRFLYDTGQYHDAIVSYKKALDEGAGALKETHVYIARAFEKTGDYKTAMKHYLKVFDIRSQDPLGAYENMAREGAERIRKRFDTRFTALRNRAALAPNDVQVQLDTALFSSLMGLYPEAEHHLLRALSLTSSRWDIWFRLGVIHMKQKRFDDAIKDFERSLMLKPDNKNTLTNMAISCMAEKDYSRAADYFERALRIDPNFLFATFNLGKIYFMTGDKQKSTEYFLKSKSIAEGNRAFLKGIDLYLRELE